MMEEQVESNKKDREEEDDQDEIYIPGLTQAALFQKLPPLRRVDGLVSKELAEQIHQEYIYQHHQLTNNLSSISAIQLIQSSAWRTLANFTFLKITNSDPSHTKAILELWAYRFRALYELQLPKLIQREMVEVFGTISKTIPLNQILINLREKSEKDSTKELKRNSKFIKAIPDLVPFSILILRARLPILLRSHRTNTNNNYNRNLKVNYHHHIDSVMKTSNALFELLEGCQRMIRYYKNTSFSFKKKLWRNRLEEVVILLSNLFSGEGGIEYEGNQEQNVGHVAEGGGMVLGFIPDLRVAMDLLQSLKLLELEEARNKKQVDEDLERGKKEETDGNLELVTQQEETDQGIEQVEEEKVKEIQRDDIEKEITRIIGDDEKTELKETPANEVEKEGMKTEAKEHVIKETCHVEPRIKRLSWVEEEEIRLRLQLREMDVIGALLDGVDDEAQVRHIQLLVMMADRRFDLAINRFLPIVQTRIHHLHSLYDLCLVNDLSVALLYSGKLTQAFEMMKKLFEQITGKPKEDFMVISKKIQQPVGDQPNLLLLMGGSNTNNRRNPSIFRLLNSLIFNYTTLIELYFGSNADQFKLEFLNQLLSNSASLHAFNLIDNHDVSYSSSNHDNLVHTSISRLSLLDLISFHSFKLPASYFQHQ